MKNHKCQQKRIISADDSVKLQIGFICSGCAKEWKLKLVDLRLATYRDDRTVSLIKEALKTREGRLHLLKAINS